MIFSDARLSKISKIKEKIKDRAIIFNNVEAWDQRKWSF